MFTRTRGKHHRPPHRGRNLVALLSIAILALCSLVASQPAGAAGPVALGFSAVEVADGTGQGTPNACPITGASGDNTPTDQVVCSNDGITYHLEYGIPNNTTVTKKFVWTLPAPTRWQGTNQSSCEGSVAQGYTGVYSLSSDGQTLTCTITFLSGQARSGALVFNAAVAADAPDQMSVTAPLTISDADGSNSQTSNPAAVLVRSLPRVDLEKSVHVITQSGGYVRVRVTVAGYVKQPLKGYAPLDGAVTFTDDLSNMPAGTTLATSGDCYVGPVPAPLVPAGDHGTWTCSQTGSQVTVTVTGARTDGNGNQLTSEGLPVLSGAFDLNIPVGALPAAPATQAMSDILQNFDPYSLAADGTTKDYNYAPNPTQTNATSGYEPGGAPGDTCQTWAGQPAGAPNNNCASLSLNQSSGLTPTAPYFKKTLQLPRYASNYVMPGEGFRAQLDVGITNPAQSNVVLCDKFDPAQQQLDTDPTGPNNGAITAALGSSGPWTAFTVEYTNRAYADDAARQATDCSDSNGPWFSSVAAAGGVTAITGVRVTLTQTLPTTGEDLQVYIPMKNVDTAVDAQNVERVTDASTLTYGTNGGRADSTAWYLSSLNLVSTGKAALDANSNTMFSAAAGATVHYRLTPALQASDGVARVLTVTDTLPTCEYDPVWSNAADPTTNQPFGAASAAAWNISVTPANLGPDGLPCTADDVSGAVVTFVSKAPITPGNAPPIDYDVTVSLVVADNSVMSNKAVVSAPGNSQAPADRTTYGQLTARAAQQIASQKLADAKSVEVGDQIGYTVEFTNNSTTTAGKTQWIDVLPYNGDANSSVVHGSVAVTKVDPLGGLQSPTNALVEYTSDTPSALNNDPQDATNQSGGSTHWCTSAQFGSANCPSSLASVTAVRVTINDLAAGFSGGLHFVTQPTGDHSGDLFNNRIGPGHSAVLAQDVPANGVSVAVQGSTIGHLVWNNTNKNGVVDPGEAGIGNVKVNLYSGSTLVGTTTTAADGTYVFDNLHSGTYSVKVDTTTLPAGDVATYDLDNGTTNPNSDSGAITLGVNSVRNDANFGYASGTASIKVTKSASATTVSKVGDVVTYSFLVENTGDVDLSSVSVTDTQTSPSPAGSLDGPINCNGQTTLAAHASMTCTATYTVTQADIDFGSITDTATATGTPVTTGTPITSPPSSATVGVTQSTPGLTVDKTTTTTVASAVGTKVPFTVTVTNNGNQTLSNLSVTDDVTTQTPWATGTVSGPITCQNGAGTTVTSLAPGAQATCQFTYTVTQADVDHGGTIADTATATARTPGNTNVTGNDGAQFDVTGAAHISVVKSTQQPSFAKAGDAIDYTVDVTNDGSQTLSNVQLSDSMTAPAVGLTTALTCQTVATPSTSVTFPIASMPPGEHVRCTGSYKATQADVDNGSITNTASVDATPPAGAHLTPKSSVTSTSTVSNGLTVTKTPDKTVITTAGEVVTFTATVTNSGNQTVSNLDVTDAEPSWGSGTLSAVDCNGVTSLNPGATVSCTFTYTVSQADLDQHAGTMTDTVSAAGSTPSGPVSGNAPATITLVARPSITVIKSTQQTTFAKSGDAIGYTVDVTNNGSQTLSNVQLSDVMTLPASGLTTPLTCSTVATPAASVTFPIASMPPGEHVRCTGSYHATQADVDNGSITNTASVDATPPAGAHLTPSSSVTSTATVSNGLTVTKTPDTTLVSSAGEVVTFTATVTNSGNQTVSSLNVTDAEPSWASGSLSAIDCKGVTSLDPGAKATCTFTYTVSQADLDQHPGPMTDTVTANGSTPRGPVSGNAPATITLAARASIAVVKSTQQPTFAKVGDAIDYTIYVTNDGSQTLSNVQLSDAMTAPAAGLTTPLTCQTVATPSTSVTFPIASMPPGEHVRCTGSYQATQADVDNGSITNTASVDATPPTGAHLVPKSSVTSTASVSNGLTVTKTPDKTTITKAGEVVTYTVGVQNTGNRTLHALAVTDAVDAWAKGTTSAITCAQTTLTPQSSTTCTFTYTAVQSDVDHGGTLNDTATATALDPSNNTVSNSASAQVTITQSPALTVVKTADQKQYDKVGQKLTDTITVTNTGNVTLAISVSDLLDRTQAPIDVSCLVQSLAPGEATTCTTAEYVVTQADLDAGSVTDTATAIGTPLAGDPVTEHSSATVPATPQPGLTIIKTGESRTDANGKQYIYYSFTVTNTGNQTLHAVAVHDAQAAPAGKLTSGPTCPTSVLAPGEVMTCHATYYVTQADLDHGSVSDTATATGRTPKPTQVTSPPDTLKITFVKQSTPGLAYTGTPVLEIVGGGLLLLAAGVFLMVIGARRRKA